MNDYKTELEDLTGILINGDITPIVVKLLKDTVYKDELLRYLGCEINKTVEEEVTVVKAPCFEDMFAQGAIVTRR